MIKWQDSQAHNVCHDSSGSYRQMATYTHVRLTSYGKLLFYLVQYIYVLYVSAENAVTFHKSIEISKEIGSTAKWILLRQRRPIFLLRFFFYFYFIFICFHVKAFYQSNYFRLSEVFIFRCFAYFLLLARPERPSIQNKSRMNTISVKWKF